MILETPLEILAKVQELIYRQIVDLDSCLESVDLLLSLAMDAGEESTTEE